MKFLVVAGMPATGKAVRSLRIASVLLRIASALKRIDVRWALQNGVIVFYEGEGKYIGGWSWEMYIH